MKANTKYTISGKAIGIGHRLVIKDSTGGEISKEIDANTEFFHTFTTINGDIRISFLLTGVTHTNYPNFEYGIKNFQLEEGTVATEHQICRTHKIEILSYGKNLFDGEWKDGIGIHTSSGLEYENPNQTVVKNYIRVKPNTKYFVGNGTFTIWVKGYGKIINKKDAKVIKTYFNNGNTYFETDNNTYFVRVEVALVNKDKVVIISEGEQSQLYEPYQEDKTQILLDEPLMRLPNGIYDEITRDGKLIKRIGKYIFTGDENISNWITTGENTYGVGFKDLSFGLGSYHHIEILSTILPNKSPSSINGANDVEGIALWDNNNFVRFRVNRTRLDSQDATGVKKWLKNLYQQGTPLTIYYKLSEPITTELPAPYLRIFKDGHLTFNTLVAPESNHVVQLNKSAQIERSIREVQGLDGRVGQLESFYDDMILETSHKLNLLTYDFEYTKESEDI